MDSATAPLPTTIAIDGPGSSGKSTIGLRLARRLGYLYFDTGSMYRAVTAAALRRNVALDDEAAITELAHSLAIDVLPVMVDDGRQYTVLVDGEDLTWSLRSAEVDSNVSAVAAYAGVRAVLTERMRTIGGRGRVVMVGRDIGTVVMPAAAVKLYLDAGVDERARRRHKENLARGLESERAAVLESLRERDRIDSMRSVAPLRPAPDAHVIDTTELTPAEVMSVIEDLLSNAKHPLAVDSRLE